MYKNKPFIVFEGIEGSGKSYHSKKIINFLKNNKIPHIYLREPGGSKNAENIRKLILTKKSKTFNPITDTLLYLAARNENFLSNIKPNYHKKVIICDRFVDSTLAYQSYGLGINKNLINLINRYILKKIKPDFTFLMKIDVNESAKRITKRSKNNRYDNFKKKFYKKVQAGYLNLSKSNKSKYMIIDSKQNITFNQNIILNKFKKLINYNE